MSFDFNTELQPRDPFVATADFGRGMAAGAWSAEQAATELAGTLMAILCDPDTVTEDFVNLSTRLDGQPMNPRSKLFAPMVRLAARGIALRDEDDEPIAPPPADISIETLISNSTEGITWESEEGERYRKQLARKTGGLLKSLVIGMDQGGYPKRRGKALVRAEVENIANEVATRVPNYAALNFVMVNDRILREAELSNPATFARTMFRVTGGYRWLAGRKKQ